MQKKATSFIVTKQVSKSPKSRKNFLADNRSRNFTNTEKYGTDNFKRSCARMWTNSRCATKTYLSDKD